MSKLYFYIFINLFFSPISFPEFITDSDYKNLVSSILNKISGTRYCKFEQISSHPWFKGFNWDDLISLDIKPGYIPKIESKIDEKEIQPYLNFINTVQDWQPTEKIKVTSRDENNFNAFCI